MKNLLINMIKDLWMSFNYISETLIYKIKIKGHL